MKTMETEQKQEKQLSFEFCGSCGGYIQPEQAAAIVRDGKPIVLCRDCKGPKQDTGAMGDTDRQAAEFALKYNLPD